MAGESDKNIPLEAARKLAREVVKPIVVKTEPLPDSETSTVTKISQGRGTPSAQLIDYGSNGFTLKVEDGDLAPVFATNSTGLVLRNHNLMAPTLLPPMKSGKTIFVYAPAGVNLDMSGHHKTPAGHDLSIIMESNCSDSPDHLPNIQYGSDTADTEVYLRSGANITLPASLARTAVNNAEGGPCQIVLGNGNKLGMRPDSDPDSAKENYDVTAFIKMPDGETLKVPLCADGTLCSEDLAKLLSDAVKTPPEKSRQR